jgi:uncharacterized membrane protein
MENTAAAPVPRLVEATRWVAVGSVAAMIVLALAWSFWLAPQASGALLPAIKILPLVAALPGLYLRRLYTYRWASLLVWLYFMLAVVTATSSTGPVVPVAAAEILLCLALFAACAIHVRIRLRNKTA